MDIDRKVLDKVQIESVRRYYSKRPILSRREADDLNLIALFSA